MDMTLLENNSKAAPFLVQLYETQQLYSVARNSDTGTRSKLAKTVIDLLEASISENEKEIIADILISLVRQAELDLRQALSERLSIVDTVPLRVVLHLANDEISVAEHVLKRSPVLSELDLLYIINAQGPDYWHAIAERADMEDSIIDALASTHDFETAKILTENEGITLTKQAISTIADMAKESDAIATPLLNRKEVPQSVAAVLYEFVGETLKKEIHKRYNFKSKLARKAVDEVVREFVEVDHSIFLPTETMLNTAKAYMTQGDLTPSLMMNTLKRGQIPSFIAQLAIFCELSVNTTMNVIRQETGQGLAIICRAHGIERMNFINIYLMTHRCRSHGKVVPQSSIAKAVAYYDKITEETARNILKK